MKTRLLLCLCALALALAGCATKPTPKPERPDVAPVRDSFTTIDTLAAELETELRKSDRSGASVTSD